MTQFRRVRFTLVLWLAVTLPTASLFAATPKEERDECARNLEAIYAAIGKFRVAHKTVPDWLSDLVPDHLADVNLLVCPVTRRTGEINNYGLSDPKIATSYLYEFCARPVPAGIQGGSARTMKEWKQLQMALLGSVVPMIRCHHHDPVLNLSFGGKLFESQGSWEQDFADVVKPEDLSPQSLFRRFGGAPTGELAPLNIAAFTNCPLTASVHTRDGTEAGPSFGVFTPGVHTLSGVAFNIQGVIHLQGRSLQEVAPERYPESVNGIPVDTEAARLHFLMGAGWAADSGATVGSLVMRYDDGSTDKLDLIYDQNVRDWVHGPLTGGTGARVIWNGDINPAPDEEQNVHLYDVIWSNPNPDRRIRSVDFSSAMTDCAPFLLAITAEKP